MWLTIDNQIDGDSQNKKNDLWDFYISKQAYLHHIILKNLRRNSYVYGTCIVS